LQLGSRAGSEVPLPTTMLLGPATSTITTSATGVEIFASAPVRSPNEIVGAIAVGTTVNREAMLELRGREGAELAVYRGGRLVASTAEDPRVAGLLGEFAAPPTGLDRLNQA